MLDTIAKFAAKAVEDKMAESKRYLVVAALPSPSASWSENPSEKNRYERTKH